MFEDIGLIFPLNTHIVSIYSWIWYATFCSVLLCLQLLEISNLQFFFLKIFLSYFCYQGNSGIIKLDEKYSIIWVYFYCLPLFYLWSISCVFKMLGYFWLSIHYYKQKKMHGFGWYLFSSRNSSFLFSLADRMIQPLPFWVKFGHWHALKLTLGVSLLLWDSLKYGILRWIFALADF